MKLLNKNLKIVFLRPYVNIRGFLKRYTLFKIGSLHIRIHTILDKDKTTLYHNHPFNYISIVIKGGYVEKYIKNNEIIIKNNKLFTIIKRDSRIYHRIEEIKKPTITLFIAYGKYDWSAINTVENTFTDGVFEREINNKILWSKRENGIWFIGNVNKDEAFNETRHSVHQV